MEITTKGSTSSLLREDLAKMVDQLVSVIREIPVRGLKTRGRDFIFLMPDYYWEKPTASQAASLHVIKRNYEEWIELLISIFRNAPDNVDRKIKDSDAQFRKWLELERNWSLRPDADHNESMFRNDSSKFGELIDILDSADASGIIIIPDTNSIVVNPNPIDYRVIVDDKPFIFLLLPTVLSELDNLKNQHRNSDFRDKVKKVITQIKGWRNQGSLRNGVTVDSTITVRAIANDPNMENAISWLDHKISDDRIIASVLEVQSTYPSDQVILVTGDVNLMNKADAARINLAEI